MAFTREELASYEKGPQKAVPDTVSPFRGATPAKAASAADVAAVAAGQIDATPGGAPQGATPAAVANADSPVVDEDGTLGDPTDSGEGTSDEDADPSTATADPSGESDPNADLTGDQGGEEPPARPAPAKGSAAERIVELNDLMEGYKVFGQRMQDQLKEASAEIARLRGGGTTTPPAVAPVVAPPVAEIKDEPMPDLADPDVAFDNDKYRAKMQKWSKDQARLAAREAVREVTGADATQKLNESVDAKVAEFAKTHPDFKTIVTDNPVLAKNQLAPDAGLAVAQSEHTADLLYAFGQDPGLAIRVARQSPAQQLLTIGKMIAKIEADKLAAATATKTKTPTAQPPGAKPGQKKSITQAPPPPRPTPAAGRPAARDQLDPNMDMNEFARQHRAGKQAGRDANRRQRGLV